MKRRAFIAALGGAAAWPLVARAQQPGTPVIGFLNTQSPDTFGRYVPAFGKGLKEMGYVEGQNVAVEERWAEGQNDRFPALVAELIRVKVDLLLMASTSGALAATAATATIPIVFVGAADPVGNRLVASMGRPGGNITGFSQGDDVGFGGKRLALLKEAVPKLAQVAVLWNPTARGLENRLKEIYAPAATLKVRLKAFEVREASQLDGMFAAIARARVDGLTVLTDPLTLRHRASVVSLAAKHRLPAVYGFGEFVRAGGFMVYGANIPDLFYRAAAYVDRILKGARPADLPVEEPTKFELVINLKAAKGLGLTIPQSLLARADEVIQ
jgi:putative ABC transport system substrate-binding protein